MSWHPFRDARTRAGWKRDLRERQKNRCALCGHRFPAGDILHVVALGGYVPTFDHVVPRSLGGADDISNFRLVHGVCNAKRGVGDGVHPPSEMPRVLRYDPG